MRALAGTTLVLSTVAQTPFSSATAFGSTVKVSAARACGINIASIAAITRPLRIGTSLSSFRRPIVTSRRSRDVSLIWRNARAPLGTRWLTARAWRADRRRTAIDLIERAHEFTRRRTADRIPDRLSVAPRGDEAVPA